METVARLLASALVAKGHSVTVVTNQSGPKPGSRGVRVVRRPTIVGLLNEYRRAEGVILQDETLRLGWPLIWLRRQRAIMVHHMMGGVREKPGLAWLGEQLRRKVRHAAVSRALAGNLPCPVDAILPNPYDDQRFRKDTDMKPMGDILFVGRLIPSKGAVDLVTAMAQLRRLGKKITVTLVGEGPERGRLEQLTKDHQLLSSVNFAGQVTGEALGKIYQQHRVLAVPSKAPEGFGLVALEAIACGCVVVGSRMGGLPEAIGPCGVTFPAGDVGALVGMLSELLESDQKCEMHRAHAPHHLQQHRPSAVAGSYLKLLLESPGVQACAETVDRKHVNFGRANSCVSL